ncbi:MAG: hypothetical protein R3E87_19290 [Burkholderiaceae bacterium]
MTDATTPTVRHFRHFLMWPLQLIEPLGFRRRQPWWELFEAQNGNNLWTAEESAFELPERPLDAGRYHEFMAFLPSVRRFLYGQGRSPSAHTGYGESPIRVYARKDIDRVEIDLDGEWRTTLAVLNCRLYFFFDVDIVILTMEVAGDDLPLARVIDLQHRFGRAFPSSWGADGRARHCARLVRWLDANGVELGRSDFDDADKYLQAVRVHRAAAVAEHWTALLSPMVLHFSMLPGPLRYRQVEYQRMPTLSFIAVDDPFAIDESDHVRLAMGLGAESALAHSAGARAALRSEHAYDRLWAPESGRIGLSTRLLTNGHATTLLGSALDPAFTDQDGGLLADFRNQIKLVVLVAHFHRAALVLQSDTQVLAVSQLDPDDPASVNQFKRRVRASLQSFLRFNHRYWFHEISNQPMLDVLFRMMRRHLNVDALFDEVREEVLDMGQYLDSDDVRRQSESVLRLTVVTIFGMAATIGTGFLGMNIFAMSEWSAIMKLVAFLAVMVPTLVLTILTVRHSRRLSRLLDRLGREGGSSAPASAPMSVAGARTRANARV